MDPLYEDGGIRIDHSIKQLLANALTGTLKWVPFAIFPGQLQGPYSTKLRMCNIASRSRVQGAEAFSY